MFAPGEPSRPDYIRNKPAHAQTLIGPAATGEFYFHCASYRFEEMVNLRGIVTDDAPQPGPAQGVLNGQLGESRLIDRN